MYERSSALVDRKFREYLVPTILTSAAVSLTAVVDSLIVGNLLGEAALSATGLASPVIFSLNALFFLFGVGGATIAAVARGRRDADYANRIFTLTFAGWNGHYVWLSFALSELATLLVVLGVSVRIRQKEKAAGLLLLRDDGGGGTSADFSVPATVDAGAGLSARVIEFCRENGADESGALRIGIAVEEMVVNTARYGHENAEGVIDVLMRVTGRELILRLRDDGVPFNPADHRGSKEEYAVGGIEVVRRLAKSIIYARQLGFNVTIITVPQKELAKGR
jgi:anti-sigma regulatory factor (Ser/Thr protein kinase)